MQPQIVIDTNVFFAALASRSGPSFAILERTGKGQFGLHLSVPLVLQYEDVAKRGIRELAVDPEAIDDILDYICLIATHQDIFYIWRSFLPDPGDDLILDLAVTARCSCIVTYNLRHFRGVEKAFGIKPVTPIQFLRIIGATT